MAAQTVRAGVGNPINLVLTTEASRPINAPGGPLHAKAELVKADSAREGDRQLDSATFKVEVTKRGRMTDKLQLAAVDSGDFVFFDNLRGERPLLDKPHEEYTVYVQPSSTDASIAKEMESNINARTGLRFYEDEGGWTQMSVRAEVLGGSELSIRVEREKGLTEDEMNRRLGWR